MTTQLAARSSKSPYIIVSPDAADHYSSSGNTIKAALDSLASTGGVIDLQPGVYSCSAPIDLPNTDYSIQIQGKGYCTEVEQGFSHDNESNYDAGQYTFENFRTPRIASTVPGKDIPILEFYDMFFINDTSTFTLGIEIGETATSVSIYGPSNVRIVGCRFRNCGALISCSGLSEWTQIRGNHFRCTGSTTRTIPMLRARAGYTMIDSNLFVCNYLPATTGGDPSSYKSVIVYNDSEVSQAGRFSITANYMRIGGAFNGIEVGRTQNGVVNSNMVHKMSFDSSTREAGFYATNSYSGESGSKLSNVMIKSNYVNNFYNGVYISGGVSDSCYDIYNASPNSSVHGYRGSCGGRTKTFH